ncbi:MAG: 4Fe-4S binding protein [Rickettsiales bacterium]|jgi:Fe-S-cluster-containing hydrogenase component 2|nr:4Fe-4S binding protein [Rickettsiales bacterium]
MKVFINHKVCDMSPACGGIRVCPTGAMFWDAANGRIGHDAEKCIGCGACEKECPIAQAIRLARDAAEEKRIAREIADDPRRAEDLFVDRYGGDFALTKDTASEDAMALAEKTPGLVVMELNKEDLIRCLLMSVPLGELFGSRDKWTHIKVMSPSDELLAGLGVSELPALVLFRDGKQIGKVEGYFENCKGERDLLESKIKKLLQ